MKIDKKISKLICELEYLIGSECYNPNSYDGWNDVDGCDFRYPINFPNKEGEYRKIRSKITDSYIVESDDISADTVEYMKYKFGSNELYIGKGIISILEYLEERYSLDFNELENNVKKK
ncbi:MAG: hypothetical protein PUE12_01855 [Oscillospiraceae bacterium]|nr:hypothetical protein [Oscillospiraceae bacterium]